MTVIRSRVTYFVLLSMVSMVHPALADSNVTAASVPSTGAPGQPPAAASSDHGSQVAAAILLGVAVIAIGAGTFLVVAKNRRIGDAGVQESNLVPVGLGIAAGGVALAMVGTFLWFRVPRTSAQVAVGPSGLLLSGSF